MADYSSSIRLDFIGSKKEEQEANEIIANLLSEADELGNEYSDAFADDAAISNYDLKDIVDSSAKTLADKFPSSRFEITGAYSHLSAEGEARYKRVYDGTELHGVNVDCPYDFDGCCPACRRQRSAAGSPAGVRPGAALPAGCCASAYAEGRSSPP